MCDRVGRVWAVVSFSLLTGYCASHTARSMSVYILYTYEMLLISNEKIKKGIYEATPDHCNPRYRSLNIMR